MGPHNTLIRILHLNIHNSGVGISLSRLCAFFVSDPEVQTFLLLLLKMSRYGDHIQHNDIPWLYHCIHLM